MALIYRPFFIVTFGSSYPWGGTAVTDNFYGTGEWAERPVGKSAGPRGLRVDDIAKFGMSVVDPLANALAKINA